MPFENLFVRDDCYGWEKARISHADQQSFVPNDLGHSVVSIACPHKLALMLRCSVLLEETDQVIEVHLIIAWQHWLCAGAIYHARYEAIIVFAPLLLNIVYVGHDLRLLLLAQFRYALHLRV